MQHWCGRKTGWRMHELSLAGEIVRIVEAAAQRDHFSRVVTLRLAVGALAGVELAALRFALDAMVPGTCLAGAVVEIDEPLGRAQCSRCGEEVTIQSRTESCPRCGGYTLRPTGGDTLRVCDILVAQDEKLIRINDGSVQNKIRKKNNFG